MQPHNDQSRQPVTEGTTEAKYPILRSPAIFWMKHLLFKAEVQISRFMYVEGNALVISCQLQSDLLFCLVHLSF